MSIKEANLTMINISVLDQYFPSINKPLHFDDYTFTILLQQGEDNFVVNLRIKQQDTKEEHHIKFRFGIGKDRKILKASHETDKPHFEIHITKRERRSFSATVYFTFQNPTDDQLLNYTKGAVVLIDKIIKNFIKNRKLDEAIINKLIFDKQVVKDLNIFEPILIEALYQCYKHSNLIVRQDGEAVVVKTPHNLKKYLGFDDLKPLYLPLLEKIEK